MTATQPLGKIQKIVLGALVGYSPPFVDRPYPGGGWQCGSSSKTIRLLESLVKRGLVTHTPSDYRCGDYRISEDGRRYLAELSPRLASLGVSADA